MRLHKWRPRCIFNGIARFEPRAIYFVLQNYKKKPTSTPSIVKISSFLCKNVIS